MLFSPQLIIPRSPPIAAAASGFAIITHAAAGGSAGAATTAAIDTTGANLLVVAISGNATSTGSVSDSKGNAWTALTDSGGGPYSRIFYSANNPTVGSGHTFTVGSGAGFPAIAAAAFSGSNVTPFDTEATGTGTSAAPVPGAGITPNQNNSLVIAGASTFAGTLTAIDGGFTITDAIAFAGSLHFGVGLAYLIQTAAAAADPNWTNSLSTTWAATIASFKPA